MQLILINSGTEAADALDNLFFDNQQTKCESSLFVVFGCIRDEFVHHVARSYELLRGSKVVPFERMPSQYGLQT